jgi:hypothetical protein
VTCASAASRVRTARELIARPGSSVQRTSCRSPRRETQSVRSLDGRRWPSADAPAHGAASGLDRGRSRAIGSGVLDHRTLGARSDIRGCRCSSCLGLLAGANSPLGHRATVRLGRCAGMSLEAEPAAPNTDNKVDHHGADHSADNGSEREREPQNSPLGEREEDRAACRDSRHDDRWPGEEIPARRTRARSKAPMRRTSPRRCLLQGSQLSDSPPRPSIGSERAPDQEGTPTAFGMSERLMGRSEQWCVSRCWGTPKQTGTGFRP